MSKATVPIYGTIGSALKTTTRISKLEKFGFFQSVSMRGPVFL